MWYWRTSFHAASTDSEPPLVKNTWSSEPGAISASLAGQLDRRRMGHAPVGRERQLDQLPTRDLGHLGAERVAELGAEQVRQAVEVAPAQAVDHEHALAPLEHEQLDVSVAGPAVAREVEQQMVGGGNRRAHVRRR